MPLNNYRLPHYDLILGQPTLEIQSISPLESLTYVYHLITLNYMYKCYVVSVDHART